MKTIYFNLPIIHDKGTALYDSYKEGWCHFGQQFQGLQLKLKLDSCRYWCHFGQQFYDLQLKLNFDSCSYWCHFAKLTFILCSGHGVNFNLPRRKVASGNSLWNAEKGKRICNLFKMNLFLAVHMQPSGTFRCDSISWQLPWSVSQSVRDWKSG